jgi:2',3'-cyclic-nucleotide 2'-phosphodiesterase / 3'-nucleotidase / 5'-nucleotidase
VKGGKGVRRKIRRSMKRRILTTSLVSVLAFSGIPYNVLPSVVKAEGTVETAPTATLRILETTDLHSNVLSYDYFKDAPVTDYGLTKTATLIKQAREQVKNSMLFDAGDTIQGNPLASYVAKVDRLGPDETHPIFKAMNYLDYDAGIVGNHEFNYGLDYLNDVLEEAKFPIVNANIYHDDQDKDPSNDKNYFTPYQMIDKKIIDDNGQEHSIKVGVIGFAPPQIMQWDKDHLVGKVIVKDIVAEAKKYIPKMKKEGADVIVAIAHSGCDITSEGQELAENAVYDLTKVEGIDAMLFGHAHLRFPEDASFKDKSRIDQNKGTINGIHAVEAGYWGNNLGVLDLALVQDKNGKWKVDKANSKAATRPVDAHTAEDENIVKNVKDEHQATLDYVRSKIGETKIPMHSFFTRVMDDAVTQIVNAAQMDYVKKWIEKNAPEYKDVPVLSAAAPFKGGRGGVGDYTNIAKGDVSIKSAADLYLFDNTLKALEVTGDQVKRWIEKSAEQFNTIDPNKEGYQELLDYDFRPYNYDVLDGVKYQIDVTKPVGQRVINLTLLDGTPVDPNGKYIVATNNYRAGGSGGLAELKNAKVVVDSPFENRQILMDYISSKGTINPAPDNNWQIAPVGGKAKLVFHSSPDALAYLSETPNVKDLGASKTKEGYQLFELVQEKVPTPNENVKVQILGINDFHGQIDITKTVNGKPVGRADYLAAYLKEREATNPNTLLVHVGDAVGASSPASALLQDEPTIKILNKLGFDLGTLGNHEFDEGVKEMLRLIHGGEHPVTKEKYGVFEGADFPYVAANVIDKNTNKPLLDPYKVVEVGGVKVGFIGVVYSDTPSIVIPSGVEGVTFTDEVEAINKYTEELKAQGVKAIVVLAHNPGYSNTDGTGAVGEVVDFANQVDDEVDIIFGAHDHRYLNATVDNKLLVQAYSSGTAIADVDLEIDPETKDIVNKKAEVVTTFQEGVTPDPEIKEMVETFVADVEPIINEVVGVAATELTGEQNEHGESTLGNLIADSMRAEMNTDFAFMNPGGIRANLNAGEITWGELFTIQPFGNDLVKMTLTGAKIRELLNQQFNPEKVRMLQISGLSYTWSNELPYGEKVLDIYLPDGSLLDEDAEYTVTVNNFMAGGGDNYTALLDGKDKVIGPTDIEGLVNYVKAQNGPISAKIEGRHLKVILTHKWIKLNGHWYYFDQNGNKVTGWEQINGKWYFFNEEGIMQTGWYKEKGKWYYLDATNGDMKVNWARINGKWYFFNSHGDMKTGWHKEKGKWYYLDAINGDMKVNWAKINGKWYFFNSHGDMKTGWHKEKGKWYYLDAINGDMKVNWAKINGKWYYFNSNGEMQTGWIYLGRKWYFLDKINGDMKTGWIQDGTKWYYLYPNGEMAVNTVINGYRVGKDGAWIR